MSASMWFNYEMMEEDQLVKRIVGSDLRSMKLRGRPQTGWMV